VPLSFVPFSPLALENENHSSIRLCCCFPWPKLHPRASVHLPPLLSTLLRPRALHDRCHGCAWRRLAGDGQQAAGSRLQYHRQ
jgi:hypothetical protein